MLNFLKIFTALFICAPGQNAAVDDKVELNRLYSDFVDPPQQARPWVWWHWMNGNVTKEGIRKDLLWMHEVGIGGFHLIDVNLATPQVVPERLGYMTPKWNDAFSYAMRLADSLSIEAGIPAAPGWSSTGGPWVKPEDGMKKVVWKQMVVEGGKVFKGTLPEPCDVSGPYQNMKIASTSGDKRDIRYYTDVAVIAARLPENYISSEQMGATLTSSCGDISMEQMTDGDLQTLLPLPYSKTGTYVQYNFDRPQTIRSLTLVRSHQRLQWGAIPAYCVDSLQVSDDGVNFRTIMGIPVGNLYSQTISFAPVTAKHFRLLSTVRKNSRIAEFVLYPYAQVNHAEEKAAYASPHDIILNPTPQVTKGDIFTDIVDITDKFKDGILEWKVPEGDWIIWRFGASLTGKRNHPAPLESTGLEVDKLDRDAWKSYFRDYLDLFKTASGGFMGERGLGGLCVDSYEAGLCNWTSSLRDEFETRRGYDLNPWLPAMTGAIIGSPAETERFLWDLRTTIGELFAENYRSLKDIAAAYGLKDIYIEAHENSRVFVADGMSVKSGATIPMGAMWMDGGRWDRVHEGFSDIKESSSTANIYGQKIVAAESFTINGAHKGKAYSYCPANLVGRANLMMSAGVNRFVIHESAHQPVDDKIPGVGLGKYGVWFNRHETWAWKAKPWLDYLARNCHMLQTGHAVADILYFYGEDNNVTGLFSNSEIPVPEGYGYDFVNSDALLNVLELRDGKLVAPSSGNRYSVLYLHPVQTDVMSLKVLKRVVQAARDGVTVCGNIPERPASLSDSQKEFDKLVEELRGCRNVYEDKTIAEVVKIIGISKDFDSDGLEYVHRTAPSAEIYWICNPSFRKQSRQVALRCIGRKPEIWDPVTGKRYDVSYRILDGYTVVDLEIERESALIIVLGEPACESEKQIKGSKEKSSKELDCTWVVEFDAGRGVNKRIVIDRLSSLSLHPNPAVRYFSGTARYKTKIHVDSVSDEMYLDLGDVHELARVWINGVDAGVIWKSPFKVDVSSLIKHGVNVIEVEVTNLWVNRLIGDASKPKEDKETYTTAEFYKPNSLLIPSGLIGPVRLIELE